MKWISYKPKALELDIVYLQGRFRTLFQKKTYPKQSFPSQLVDRCTNSEPFGTPLLDDQLVTAHI